MAGLTRFRMPAEWERHEATWISWPHESSDWPGKFATIPWVYGEIVRHLARVEKVRILIEDSAAEKRARRVLQKCGVALHQIEFFHYKTNRSWCRDYCPIFVRAENGQLTALNWIFNGWAKYENYHLDNGAPPFIAERLNLPRVDPGAVLEGGAIDVNGAGALLTTEECLLSEVQARNPHLSRADIEKLFSHYLGIDETIWLKCGIEGDDTHGHVDDVARFVNTDTIVLVDSDPENLVRLRHTKYNVVPLPMPDPLYFDGQRLPASYANFYIANGLVLVPVFNDANDRVALNTLAELFPDRQVIGIGAVDLVLGLGTLHCLTQQQPAA
jgi:agmatine deiminase